MQPKKTVITRKTIHKTTTIYAGGDPPPITNPALDAAFLLVVIYDMRNEVEVAVATVSTAIGSPIDGRPSPDASPRLTLTQAFADRASADAAYMRLAQHPNIISRTVQSAVC